MATNYVGKGDVVTVVCPAGGVDAGDSVLIGVSLFGVATHDAAAGADLELAVSGVWSLGKDTALVITQGDRVYWDAGNGWVDKTLAAQTCVGIALETTLAATATVNVLLGNTADLAGG
jgi:predicted RecA/RadA family phage recombinase